MKHYPVLQAALPNGETIAYRCAGAGDPTVVLIHGNMSSSVHWQTTMEALEDDFRLYAPDLRGFGDSTYHTSFDSLRDLAHDVEEFLDATGIGRCEVVGWSTGGGVAMEMAADRPDQIAAVVLVDSVPPTGYPIFAKDETGQPILTQLLETKEEIASDPVQVVPALKAFAAGDKATMRAIWDATIYNRHTPEEADYDLYLDASLRQRNLVDVDYSLLTFNMTDTPTAVAPGSGRLAKIACPVTVLHGGKDIVVPLAWAQQTARLLGEGTEVVTFADSGHSPITDEPGAFMSTLRDVLSR